jgi:hypothetical protein
MKYSLLTSIFFSSAHGTSDCALISKGCYFFNFFYSGQQRIMYYYSCSKYFQVLFLNYIRDPSVCLAHFHGALADENYCDN